MVTFRVNKKEFPFSLTQQQYETLNNLLNHYKRTNEFSGCIKHIMESNKMVAYAFAGWFLEEIAVKKKPDSKGFDLPEGFEDIFGKFR